MNLNVRVRDQKLHYVVQTELDRLTVTELDKLIYPNEMHDLQNNLSSKDDNYQITQDDGGTTSSSCFTMNICHCPTGCIV